MLRSEQPPTVRYPHGSPSDMVPVMPKGPPQKHLYPTNIELSWGEQAPARHRRKHDVAFPTVASHDGLRRPCALRRVPSVQDAPQIQGNLPVPVPPVSLASAKLDLVRRSPCSHSLPPFNNCPWLHRGSSSNCPAITQWVPLLCSMRIPGLEPQLPRQESGRFVAAGIVESR